MGDDEVMVAEKFPQDHEELVYQETWWWAVHICLCVIAVLANLIFIITVVYNRRRNELKTFVTAVITTAAVLDILDVGRILPVLSPDMFDIEIYRHVYCSFGVFHELAVAIFIVSIGVAVCVQAGKENKLFNNDPCANIAHKILIPIVLLLTAGAAVPIYLLTYVLPILILPLALPIATLRTCIARQCCVTRYKQPIGELIMTTIVGMLYLGTIVGVVLPRIAEMVKIEELDPAKKAKAPLLWELGNNAIRPLVYFMTNPAVRDGLRNLCCRKKHQMVNDDEDEV